MFKEKSELVDNDFLSHRKVKVLGSSCFINVNNSINRYNIKRINNKKLTIMNTFLLTVVAVIASVVFYFASVRYLVNIKSIGEKTREFLQFLLHYAVVFVAMVFVLYSVKLGDSRESWHLGLFSVLSAAFMTFGFCFVPTFLLAYFLYPFKFIERRTFSKWIFIAVASVFVIYIIVFAISLSFSNM
jgi:uncharacterized membrane protein